MGRIKIKSVNQKPPVELFEGMEQFVVEIASGVLPKSLAQKNSDTKVLIAAEISALAPKFPAFKPEHAKVLFNAALERLAKMALVLNSQDDPTAYLKKLAEKKKKP